MEILWALIHNCWQLLLMMSPYLLLGIVAAGLLHLWIPLDFIRRHLSRARFGSVVKAAVFGAPLPLCSCSVIPLAVALKNSGANKGAVLSFLISTPTTGVDSIIATYGVFGWLFTLYRLLSAIVLAIIAGLLALVFTPAKSPKVLPVIANESSLPDTQPVLSNSVQRFFDYTLNVVFKDLAKSFMIGILLGGVMLTLMPSDWESLLSEQVAWTYVLMLLIAPALYICATGSIPLAASLLLAGFSPGAAFILLTAGPATSTVTMSVVYQSLGKTCFAVYLLTIVIGSLLFAVLLDSVLDMMQVDVRAAVQLPEQHSIIYQVSAGLMSGLLLYYLLLLPLWQRYARHKQAKKSCCSSC